MIASAHIAPFTVPRLEVGPAESCPKQPEKSLCQVNADGFEKSPFESHGPVTEYEMKLIKHVIDTLSLGLEGVNADLSQRLAIARNAAIARRRL